MTKLPLSVVAAAVLAVALPAIAQTPTAPPIRVAKGRFTMKDGEAIYKNVCQACQMSDAMGAKGAGIYPALANNKRLAASPYAIRAVVLGQKGMPPFGAYFDDEQVAAVVGYVRTHFGNSYAAPVTAAEVKAVRSAPAGPTDVHGGLPTAG
ncbi:MAG: c-type cytochrome [Caulobacteraceae bacterium]